LELRFCRAAMPQRRTSCSCMKDSFWTSHHQSHRHDCTAAIAISSALSSWLLLQQQVELKTSAIPRSQSTNQTSIIHLCRRLPCNGHHQISPYLHCNYKQMRWSSWSHLLLPVFKILEICLWFVFFFLDETGIKAKLWQVTKNISWTTNDFLQIVKTRASLICFPFLGEAGVKAPFPVMAGNRLYTINNEWYPPNGKAQWILMAGMKCG
jgi:hypothetical protein